MDVNFEQQLQALRGEVDPRRVAVRLVRTRDTLLLLRGEDRANNAYTTRHATENRLRAEVCRMEACLPVLQLSASDELKPRCSL